MTKKIALLPGDGIGPEIIAEAEKVLLCLKEDYSLDIQWDFSPIGGAAYDLTGTPLPDETLDLAQAADAVLLGAVGGIQYDKLPRQNRPERGLLGIRKAMGLFANLRPATLYPSLADASTLRRSVVEGLDIMIVRELTGGIYFGEPRGIRQNEQGDREGFNSLVYTEKEIERIARVAFETAMKRQNRLCSVDKANVLEVSELWRDVITSVARDYPEVSLSHMYVDNAAMQLVRDPKQFDVMVTTNMFGDILSDEAAMLTGSIGMLASASLNEHGQGLYEPIHGSAPDIAGQGIANPLATILSVAMMLRYSIQEENLAKLIEKAVGTVLDEGLRTADIINAELSQTSITTAEMGDAVVRALRDSEVRK